MDNKDKFSPLAMFKKMMSKISLKDIVFNFFVGMIKTMMGPLWQKCQNIANGIKGTIDKIEKTIQKIKRIIKILKMIVKALVKFIKIVIQLIIQLFCSPPGWCVLAVIALILFFVWLSTLSEALGGFRGTVVVDVQKMKEMNVDSTEYTDLLNTDALLEAFYQDVSDRSIYQSFNLRDVNGDSVDGLTKLMINIGASAGIFSSDKDFQSRKNKLTEAWFANQKKIEGKPVYDENYVTGFSGIFNFISYDPRYIYTDANKNPLKYLKQAETIGTNSNYTKVNAYFRDYFKREKTFMLSEELLYELNRYLYMDSSGGNNIVYPEAFVKPIHFVNDYMRINNNKENKTYGEEYVYVTQRITLDDIRDQTSKFYNQYNLEGIIYSTPSNIIYDYAISDSNLHKVRTGDSESARQVNIGNVSDYAKYKTSIFYNEDDEYVFHESKSVETEEIGEDGKKIKKTIQDYLPAGKKNDKRDKDDVTEVVKLYWKVKDDMMDIHMGMSIDESNVCKYFTGPYLNMKVTNSGSSKSISLKNNLGVCPDGGTDTKANKDNLLYGVITVNKDDGSVSYSTSKDKPSSGDAFVDPSLNLYPRKHVQVAPLTNEDNDIIASSRNLFNKVYIQVKTIKNSYRSSDEYWSRFQDFIDEDLSKGAEKSKCTGEAFKEDKKLYFPERRCSTIRYYMADTVVSWIKSKGSELLAYFRTGKAEDATLEINAKAMYGILLEYEDYLMAVGSYNVEWEYKYFSETEFDKLNSLEEFDTNLYKVLTNGVSGAIQDVIGDDTIVYKNTFSAVVNDDNRRSVASEYVPVAIITGNEADNNNNSDKNAWGWGYKYTGKKDSNGNAIVKAVYGEASMQFPEYYTFGDEAVNQIFNMAGKTVNMIASSTLSSLGLSIYKTIVGFIPKTNYGEITYGMPNFKYVWNGDKILDVYWPAGEQQQSEMSNIFTDFAYETVKDESGNYIDYRNSDYVWNNSAKIWRPEKAKANETSMIPCDASAFQCGRVTTKLSKDDYLPMEVKSVRDYGLGSVLSYIESRKVVFNTGVSMGESYDSDSVKEVVSNLNNAMGSNVADPNKAEKGFVPKEFLNLNLKGYNSAGKESFMNIYRKAPATLEQLALMAQAFNSAQGSGSTSASYNGCTYTLGGGKNGSQYIAKGSGDNCLSDIYAFVPHAQQSWLADAWDWIWNGDMAMDEKQFWDPMYYYLTWFDYFNDEVNEGDDVFSKLAKIIEDPNKFNSKLDTSVAAALRGVKNGESGTYNLQGISEASSWFKKIFGDAGADITKEDMDAFFDKYSGNLNALELIDRTRTEEIYLIEEAATFIGEFMYTYKDTMKTIGNLTQEDAIINDLAFIDRHYYISNYTFALPKYEYDYETKSFSSGEKSKKSAKTKCGEWEDEKNKENDKLVWWNPTTWFKDRKKIYDNISCECRSVDNGQKCYGIATYKQIKDNSGKEPAIVYDSPEEIQKLLKKLNDKTLTDKIMINLKVYYDISEWAGLFGNNVSDFKFGVEYTNNKPIVTSNDAIGSPGYDIGNNILDNYSGLDKINSSLAIREGLIANKDKKDNIVIDDKGLINDSKYEAFIDESNLSNSVGHVNQLNKNDLDKIRKAILSLENKKDTVKNKKITLYFGDDKKEIKVKTGVKWGDKDDMLLSIAYANRANRGYPLPLYLHIAGDTKEISPDKVAEFFKGEDLESWKARVELKDDDSIFREEYVKNYHKERESYLYDYLENFEAYIPLDVKSDDDMQIRGRDAFLSIGKNETSSIELVGQSSGAIINAVRSEAYSSIIDKLGVSTESMAQLITGLMETSINNSAKNTILEYNQNRSLNGQSLIKESSFNRNNIKGAVTGSMYLNNLGEANLNNIRYVELELENNTKEKFLVPYLGIGGIKNVKFIGNGALNGSLNTKSFGRGASDDDIELTVNNTTDQRLMEQKSIDYVVTKFRKIYLKQGSIPAAIMSYFYGEAYWESLKKVAEEDGLSTGPEWYVAEPEMIEKAVQNMLGDTTININTDFYSSSVVDDVLSYVANTKERVIMIRGVKTNGFGSSYVDNRTGDFPADVPTLKELMAREVKAGILSTSSTGYNTPGKTKAYMGWQCIGDTISGDHGCGRGTYIKPTGTNQGAFVNAAYLGVNSRDQIPSGYKLNKSLWGKGSDMNLFDSDGFGVVGTGESARYAIAVKPGYGGYIYTDESGKPKNFEIGDYLDVYLEDGTIIPCIMADAKANENPSQLLHQDGSVIEFVVNKYDWYGSKKTPVGIHKEWNQNILGIVKVGSFWGDEEIILGSSTSSGNDMFANTIGYNSYTKDSLSLQNSGIELWIPPRTISRSDVDMIMVSTGSRDGNFLTDKYEYTLLSLFTERTEDGDESEEETGIPGNWDYGSSSIAQLGTGTDRKLPNNELTGLPPLFAVNRPFKENVQMRLTSPFGYRIHPTKGVYKLHGGIDLGEPSGTEIFASAPGKVIISQFNAGGYGNYVVIEHDINCISSSFKSSDGNYYVNKDGTRYKILGVQTYYAHMVSPGIKVGTIITPENIGTPIGKVGSTGASTGPHLHYEIRVNAQKELSNGTFSAPTGYQYVDPQVWLTTSWKKEDSSEINNEDDKTEVSYTGEIVQGHTLIRNY